MPCLHAMSSLLEKDRSQRIGATGFETFTDNVFFRDIDFVALENKEIEPIFRPSSEKTNFDATYDLEELLLEEAPLEARARRQKPREQLKDDATEAEIRAESLHKMIETLFEPFDYTLIAPEDAGTVRSQSSEVGPITPTLASAQIAAEPTRPRTSNRENEDQQGALRVMTPPSNLASRSRSSTHSPNGSPPLPTVPLDFQFAPSEREQRERDREGDMERSYGIPNTHSAIPRSIPDEYHDFLKDTKSIERFEGPPPLVQPQSVPGYPQSNTAKRRRQTTASGSAAGGSSGGGSSRHPDARNIGGEMRNFGGASASGSVVNTSVGPAYGSREEEPPLGISSGDERDPKRPSGMLGFLSRKKGRDRSPKAREKGVLGKEGARQIVG
jgi:serine/threonine kinase 32